MKYIKKFFKWIWYSSVDPMKASLTVRSAGLAIIPTAIHFITLACGLGFVCLGVTNETLETIIKVVSDIVYWGLLIVSGVGFVIGLFRKTALTVAGKNEVHY